MCPGIVDLKTIENFHGPEFLENKNADNLVLDGNPLHKEALEVARVAGVDFIVNATVNVDRELTGIFCGELEAAHLAGAGFIDSYVKAPIEELYDVVITSGGGYPLDATLYQTGKGMLGAMPAVKHGGTIIVASECSEGLGSDEFKKELLGYDGRHLEFVPELFTRDCVTRDQWGVEMQFKVFRKVSLDGIVLCATGIGPELLRRCSVTSGYVFAKSGRIAEMLQTAVRHTIARKKNPRLAVIPEGPYVIPELKK